MPRDPAVLVKLTVPEVRGVIRRDRLFQRLDDRASAVWVTAPPGAGKTMLAASYLGSSKRAALWYRIDGGDADPAAFFYFLGLAADKVSPRRCTALPLLTPEYLTDLASFARRFFRTLFECLPAGSRLVFDNYHELDAVPVFHEIMREVLSEVPPGFKIIVASRTEPPQILARLIANRDLDLLDWGDLRLTPDETRALAGSVDDETAQHLHAQSGGWTAGVILLLRHSGDGEGMRLRSPQSVFNYFASEILEAAPEETRRLLVRTAFFPDFTLAMAEHVDGKADASQIFATLCRQHCFIERTGGPEGGYRYHDLFRDFLRNQAGAEASACRSGAAAVLAACGRTTEAIPLLIENADWQAAAGLIVAQAQQLTVQGRWQTLARWIDALPENLRDGTPWLLFWRGVAELPVRPSAARALIERAHENFAAAGDTVGQLLAASAVIEANYHEYADFSLLDRWRDEMESLGAMQMDFPSTEIEVRILTGMLSATYMRQPASPLGQILADRLEALLERDIDPNLKSTAATFMLWFVIWAGDFVQARRIHAWAGRLLAERSLTPLNDIMLRSVKGHGEIFLGDGAAAREVFDTAEETGHRHGFVSARICIILPMQAYRHLMFGDLAAAEGLIAESEKHPFSGPMNAAQIEFCRSWLALLRGKAPLACEHARIATELADRSGSYIARACTHSAWALGLTEIGETAAARQHLAAAWRSIEGRSTGIVSFHLLLVEAWLALRANDLARSHRLLREAFAQGAAQGYASTMQWLPRMMSCLCAEALKAGIEPDYARWLIRKRGLSPPSVDIVSWPWALEIRTLGGFEVLRDGHAIEFPRKAPKKPIALLKALIALGGHGVPEQRLADMLWPDNEADAAGEALAVTLHRLRKLLGDADAIQVKGSRIGLNPAVCRVDAWTFELLVDRANAAIIEGRTEEALQWSQSALAMYRGNFLADDIDAVWMVSIRERLRMKLVQHIVTVAKLHCEKKRCETALACYLRGLDTDDLIEKFYQELMRCHHCLGRKAEGLAVYRRMKQTLSIVLGIAPSADSERLYEALRDD